MVSLSGSASGDFPLPSEGLLIGRDPAAGIVLADDGVSWRHARIWREGDRTVVMDLGSTNGTTLEGTSLAAHQPTALAPGSRLRIGDCTLEVGPSAERKPATQLLSLPRSGEVRIGRAPGSEIVLDSADVSWRHARLCREGSGWIVEDLGSRNGTFLDGKLLKGKTRVQPGQRLRIGLHALAVATGGAIGREVAGSGSAILTADDLWHDVSTAVGPLTVLRGVTLSVRPGEMVALVGPSGAGKTTLLLALNGCLTPTRGAVRLGGHDLRVAPDLVRTAVGYVPQSDIVHGDLSVEDVLRFAGRLRLPADTTATELSTRIARVLSTLGLEGRRGSLVRTLSGGERKRVNIAIELLSKPAVLFLDEPTTGLDAGLERKVVRLMRSLARDGCTVVVVTHAIHTLDQYDRIAVMAPGGILAAFGTPGECLTAFDASDFEVLLDRATNAPPRQQVALPILSASLPAGLSRGSDGFLQLSTLLARYFRILANDRRNLGLLAGQVPVIAVLISLLFESRIFLGPQEADGRGKLPIQDAPNVLFLVALSMVCFGLFNSVREIVKEKSIYYRERHVGLHPAAYVASKALALGAVTLVQSVALLALIGLRCPLGIDGAGWLTALAALALGGICATLLGLALSAWSANTDQGVTMAALALLLMVVFSGLVPLERLSGGLKLAGALDPLRWSYGGLCGATLLPDRFAENGVERLLHDVLKTPPSKALATLAALAAALYGATHVALFLRADKDRQR